MHLHAKKNKLCMIRGLKRRLLTNFIQDKVKNLNNPECLPGVDYEKVVTDNTDSDHYSYELT